MSRECPDYSDRRSGSQSFYKFRVAGVKGIWVLVSRSQNWCLQGLSCLRIKTGFRFAGSRVLGWGLRVFVFQGFGVCRLPGFWGNGPKPFLVLLLSGLESEVGLSAGKVGTLGKVGGPGAICEILRGPPYKPKSAGLRFHAF